MTDRLISEQAVMESLTNEYNQKRTGDGLKLAWIEKAVSATPTAQPTQTNTPNTLETLDCVSRQEAIRWVKQECNPYGKPTLDFESGKRVMEHLERMPSAQPQRMRGRWEITDAYPHNVYCSECHKRFAQTHWAVWEDGSLPRIYCPNCGADMRPTTEDKDVQIQ